MTTSTTPAFDEILDLLRRDQPVDWATVRQQIGPDATDTLMLDTRDALRTELSLHTQLTAAGQLTTDTPHSLIDVRAALDTVLAAVTDAYRIAYAYAGGDTDHGLVEEIDDLHYELTGIFAHLDNGDYVTSA